MMNLLSFEQFEVTLFEWSVVQFSHFDSVSGVRVNVKAVPPWVSLLRAINALDDQYFATEYLSTALVTCVDVQLLADSCCCMLDLDYSGKATLKKTTAVCLIFIKYIKKRKDWPDQKQSLKWKIHFNCGLWLLLGSLGKFLCLQDVSQPTQLNNGIFDLTFAILHLSLAASVAFALHHCICSVSCSEVDFCHQWWSSQLLVCSNWSLRAQSSVVIYEAHFYPF